MKFLAIIGVSLITTIIGAFGIYNYLPLSSLEFPQKESKLGVSITTIAGTDTLSGSRTTINNNFTNLNNGKIENSSTSISAILYLPNLSVTNATTTGTITSGTWNASIIGAKYGGTGSSSPTGLLWGNGTSIFSIASGTANQLLTSNGGTLAPTFQTYAVDQTLNYTWTGLHRFEGATTTVKGLSTSYLYASSTLELGGLKLTFPTIINASSTILSSNATGNLSWVNLDWQQLGEYVAIAATSSLVVENFSARQDLRVVLFVAGMNARNGAIDMTFKDDGANYAYRVVKDFETVTQSAAAAQTGIVIDIDSDSNPVAGIADNEYYIFDIINRSASTKQVHFTGGIASSTIPVYFQGVGVWNNTSRQITTIRVREAVTTNTFNVGSRLTIYGKKD